MKFRLNQVEVTFDICRSLKQSGERELIYAIPLKSESNSKVKIVEILVSRH